MLHVSCCTFVLLLLVERPAVTQETQAEQYSVTVLFFDSRVLGELRSPNIDSALALLNPLGDKRTVS